MSPIPVVVLASGQGSGFEALVHASRQGSLPAEIRAVVCNREGAGVLKKAEQLGIPALTRVPDASIQNAEQRRSECEKQILSAIAQYEPRFLVLAGYDRILGPTLLGEFRSPKGYTRIVNIHPSLLPAFPGMHAYQQAYEYGARLTGVTVHLVDEELDHGPVCAQKAFSIQDCASVQEVIERGKRLEHQIYPEALSWILKENFTLERRGEAGRTFVRSS